MYVCMYVCMHVYRTKSLFNKHELQLYCIKFIYITLYYIIISYCVILHLTFILLLIYNLLKGKSGKGKFERSRPWQLDNSWRKACESG